MNETRKRLSPNERRALILKAAVALAVRGDYRNITRDAVADHAGVSAGLVSQYFPMSKLRQSIMREAVRLELLPILAQGIVARDPLALAAPLKLKARALDSIGG